MSVQRRRRGQPIVIYPRKLVTDARGNEVLRADLTDPRPTTAAVIPQRSSKAEVPGQQQIDVVRLIVNPQEPDVGLWSRVQYLGDYWDVVAPPAYHNGTRGVSHWSIDIRRRP